MADSNGLIWVKLDDSAPVELPAPSTGESLDGAAATGRVSGQTEPATVGALRRVEHLLDRAAATWATSAAARQVHPQRRGGTLLVDLPMAPLPFGLPGANRTVIRVHLPTVIEIEVTGGGGTGRSFWGASVPVDHGLSRWCWTLSGHAVSPGDAAAVTAVLVEHEQVEASKVPPELSLDRLGELSSRQDRVSVAYRRALEDLLEASRRGPQLLVAALRTAVA